MQWFKNMGFRWKITVPLSIVALIFIISSVVSIGVSRKISADANLIGNVFLKQIDLLLQADRDLYQSLVAEQSLLYIDPNNADYTNLHQENALQARDRALQALALGQMDNNEAVTKDFEKRYANWKKISNEVVALASSGNVDSAIALSRGRGEAAFEHVRHLIDVIQEGQIKQADFYTNSANVSAIDSRRLLVVILLLGLAVCTLIIVLVPPLILRPLQLISRNVTDIAVGNGDLTARVQVAGKDEIGVLASQLNIFMESLHTMVSSIKTCTDKVSGSSVELSSISETNRAAMAKQNSALDMVVSAVHEMSVAIREVAENINLTAERARDANERSSSGLKVVENTVRQIQQVASQVDQVSGLVTEVEQQVGSVTSVLDVIRGIAEQTNLLALNAAIEAARAGEQGRGFAVVADEVRTLASRTQESTTDIQDMLERLQGGVGNAVAAMRSSAESANTTVNVANEAGVALTEINDYVAQIADMAVQVAAAVEEQTAVVDDINRNLVSISDQSATTSENAQRTQHASDELGAAASELLRNVGNFKLE